MLPWDIIQNSEVATGILLLTKFQILSGFQLLLYPSFTGFSTIVLFFFVPGSNPGYHIAYTFPDVCPLPLTQIAHTYVFFTLLSYYPHTYMHIQIFFFHINCIVIYIAHRHTPCPAFLLHIPLWRAFVSFLAITSLIRMGVRPLI